MLYHNSYEDLDDKFVERYKELTKGFPCGGCCLHIVIDDGNIEDGHVQYCLEYAKENEHEHCVVLAEFLLEFTEEQRAKLIGVE